MQIWRYQPRGVIRRNRAVIGGLITFETLLCWSRFAWKYWKIKKTMSLKPNVVTIQMKAPRYYFTTNGAVCTLLILFISPTLRS